MIKENSDPKLTPPELTVIPTSYSSDSGCYLSYFAMMLLISKPKPTP
jgi:hypothetical protein